MPVVGAPRTFHKKFAFEVEIERVGSSAFTTCSDIDLEIAKVEQREGGRLIPYTEPGLVTVADVVLERGVADGDSDLYYWWLEVAQISANAGLITPYYKRDADVLQKDRDGSLLKRWLLNQGWPTKLVVGQWDNDANENVVETLTLAYDFPEKLFG